MKAKKCFKHKGRKAVDDWVFCSDGKWRGVCKECDIELNKMALRFAYPTDWKPRLKAYIERNYE